MFFTRFKLMSPDILKLIILVSPVYALKRLSSVHWEVIELFKQYKNAQKCTSASMQHFVIGTLSLPDMRT